jgi:hypothetical protein
MSDTPVKIDKISPVGECAFISSAATCIVVGPPTLKLLGAVRIVRNGAVVGQVDAVFDFSNLPARYHQTVLMHLNRRTDIGDWLDESGQERHRPEPEEPEKPKSWWRRLWGL